MSFQRWLCSRCWHTQEFYGRYVPNCPRCGVGADGSAPLTHEEYYRAMGVAQKGCTRCAAHAVKVS